MGWFDFLSTAKPEELNQAGLTPETVQMVNAQQANSQSVPPQNNMNMTQAAPAAKPSAPVGPIVASEDPVEPQQTSNMYQGVPQVNSNPFNGPDVEAKRQADQKKRIMEQAAFNAKTFGMDDNQIAQFEAGVDVNDPGVSPEQFQTTVNQAMKDFGHNKSADSFIERRLQEYDKQLNELKERKVDPNRWINSRTVGQKIWGAFAIGFGGSGGAGVIQNAINNDVKAQQDEIDTEYKILKEKGDMLKLGQKVSKEGPPDIRLMDHKVKLLNVAIDQGKKFLAKPGSNQQKIGQTIADLENERSNTIAAMSDSVRKKGGGMTDDMVDKNTPIHLLNEDQKDRFVPGFGVAMNKEAATEFRKSRNATEAALGGLQRIVKLAKTGNKLNPRDRGIMATEIQAAIGSMREKIVGPGAMSQGEFERVVEAIGNPNAVFALKENQVAKLQALQFKLQNDLNNEAKNAGLPAKKTEFNFKKSE